MKIHLLFGAASAIALATAPALAQDTNTSTSGSGAEANSGSVSGAASQSNPVQTNTNAPVNTQGNLTSTSGSNADANSGSISGASSDNTNSNAQGQTQNNAGIGNSTSSSNTNSEAYSGSISGAESNGNQQGQSMGQGQEANNSQGQGQTMGQGQSANNAQDQGQGQTQGQDAHNAQDQGQGQDQAQSANNSQSQGQTANNGQGQDQGQGQTLNNTNSLGQTAANNQGVTINQTYNTTQRRKTITEVRAATPVMLAASSSFSSDYCGGTASGGASTSAPIGITIGGAGPVFDNSCRYLRLAEKAGMLGANYHNMGYIDQSGRAMSLMAWAVCMAGPQQDKRHKNGRDNVTMDACLALGLLGSEGSAPQPPVTPMEAARPNMTPSPDGYSTVPPPQPERLKTPRGEAGDPRPLAIAH